MKIYFRLLFLLVVLFANLTLIASHAEECVVVLHGMGRTAYSMHKIEDRLFEEGYSVWNESYPSTDESIAKLAQSAVGDGIQFCAEQQAQNIHFVTHSLGGILVRTYLQDNTVERLGRIVMLAPPNQGSEIAEILKPYSLYEMAMGPAGQALGTSQDSLPNQLKPIAGEIGIIAGNVSSDPWFSPLIPGDDDGKVSVERTKLPEMRDFLETESGHTFIMRSDQVIEQVVLFLRDGRFSPDPQQ